MSSLIPSTPPLTVSASWLAAASRRRFLAPVYDELKAEIGVDRAREFLRKAVRRAAIAAGRGVRRQDAGRNGFESFRAIQPLWTKDGALEIETLQATPKLTTSTSAAAATPRPTGRWD